METISYLALFRKHRTRILWGALLFWLLIGIFVYGAHWIASHYFGVKPIDVVEQKQYLLRWVLWLLLTPLIILLALRFNTGNCKLFWLILLHIVLGSVLLSLEFMAELAIIKPLAESYYRRPVDTGELVIPFLLKYFAYIINYFLIVGMVNIYVYMHSLQTTQKSLLQAELNNKELQYSLTLARLQGLKMQLQPHFLFNVHHAVISLILQEENTKATRMLTLLSDLLRTSLEQQEREMIPLHEELSTVARYLSLQQIRFDDRFRYHLNLSEEARDIPVPFFLLQPIAENAVVHGVEKTEADTVVIVAASVESSFLQITISNSRPQQTGLRPARGMGIGISNTRERLQQHYGDAASFCLSEEAQHITVAQLLIPIT